MSRLHFHERFGGGGYGTVYRATWIQPGATEQTVAVKVLNAEFGIGSDAHQRLRDEARMLAALTHSSIVRVFEFVEFDGAVAMVTEFIDGEDLDSCVLDGMPSRAIIEVVGSVAAALASAWGDVSPVTGAPLRLVHRDIKPENIRLTPLAEVKVLDFGISRAAELRREAHTATNVALGSFRYMAPERFEVGLEPHPSMDVFSLGCILYEGFAYRKLFEGLSMREMMVLTLPDSQLYEDFIQKQLDDLPSMVDEGVVELIRLLTQRDPQRRPPPDELVRLCQRLVARQGGQSLGEWAQQHHWSRNEGEAGSLTGRVVEMEGTELELLLGTDGFPYELTEEEYATSDATLQAIKRALDSCDDEVVPNPVAREPVEAEDHLPLFTRHRRRREPRKEKSLDPEAVTQAMNRLQMATSTPIGAPRRQISRPSAFTEEAATEPIEIKKTPSPRPPVGPEPYHSTQALPARLSRSPSQQALIANVVVLILVALLGVALLVAWIVLS